MARKSTKSTAKSNIVATPSEAESNTATKPVVLPIKKGTKTFFDLPGEIRNEIYAQLLPDVPDLADMPWRDGLRADGQKTSTTFMATCKAVYQEATSILYGSLSTTEGEVGMGVDRDGKVSLFGHDTKLVDATTDNFGAIKRVRKLNLHLSTQGASDYLAICNIQDAIFTALSDNLSADHALQSLTVNIYSTGPDDGWLGMMSSNYAERMHSQSVMREFMDVRPGDISRAHLAAFLSDPLRMIRGVKDGKKKGKFTIDFVGKGGRPWRNIQGEVRNLIQGDSIVPGYKVFCDYFVTLRQLVEVGTKYPSFKTRKHPVSQLAKARIQGDMKAFQKGHASLLEHVDQVGQKLLDSTHAYSSDQVQKCEESAREMMYLCQMLDANLPPADTDTSFFGYVLADKGLLDWQTQGRAAEKEAKAKRKREKEAADGKSQKKARTG